jgi:hypothetical protein
MPEKAIPSTLESLKWIYGVVIALSIGEAFTQVVLPAESKVPGIQWDRLPSLCSLLLLVVPFYHGMSRFFCETYDIQKVRPCYGLWLLFDCVVFTIEAALFFVLARSLSKDLWWQFGWTTLILLLLDITWGILTWKFRPSSASDSISWWVRVNLGSMSCLAIVLLVLHECSQWLVVSMIASVLLARTAADYATAWDFYFPTVPMGTMDQRTGNH